MAGGTSGGISILGFFFLLFFFHDLFFGCGIPVRERCLLVVSAAVFFGVLDVGGCGNEWLCEAFWVDAVVILRGGAGVCGGRGLVNRCILDDVE